MTQRNELKTIIKDDPKIIRGWVFYDWANSVYQLTIASAIFPVYYNTVTRNGDDFTINIFGFKAINTVIYSWSIAFAYFSMALLSPLLSSIADFTGRRKAFMQFFTWLGAISCGTLFFFDRQHIEIGVIGFTLGTIGYGGSIVFYNSFLPVIASPENQDKISARGYSMGYIGSVILLLINLLFILKPGFFGIGAESSLPARLSFLSVFLWWIGFSQITFNHLPKYIFGGREKKVNIIIHGYRELLTVFNQLRLSPVMTRYLAGFFFIMMGLLTTMFMAATYGEKQLGLTANVLIPTILAIQIVGVGGSWTFAKISGITGNFRALLIAVAAWICIIIGAYFIQSATDFIVIASLTGIVMGGTQALARSTYSKLLPDTIDHTSFFSFYDIMEKMATVLGTFSFGLIEAITGNMRFSVLAIGLFFVAGFILILTLLRK